MTGDRSLLAGRISALCEEKLIFKLAEKDDYALAGLRPRRHARRHPARAGPSAPATGTELQVALLAPDASGQGQAAALQSIAAHCRSRDAAVPAARRPFRVDVLPSRISFADAWQLRPAAAGPLWGTGRRGRRHADRARARTSPPGCPASSWPAPPSQGGPPSCCPWRGRSSRPEHRSCWPRRGRRRCAQLASACPGCCGCSTRRTWTGSELAGGAGLGQRARRRADRRRGDCCATATRPAS